MSKTTSSLIALAACTFGLPSFDQSADTIEMQLTPDGEFRPSDGRTIPVKAWRMSEKIAAAVKQRFKSRGNEAVVDFEHQTLHKETNGQPAPAAGWIKDLVYRPGQGLFGIVAATARAKRAMKRLEYRYVSPVFSFDPVTGDVLDIKMAALTNAPAIDGMQALAALAARFHEAPTQETPVNRLMTAICAAFMLAPETTEDQAIAALTAVADERAKVRAALKLAPTADSAVCVAACTTALNAVDPARFVPISDLEAVKRDLAVLTAQQTESQVNALVEAGLKDGRLLSKQKDWAISLGKKDIAALTSYLQTTVPIAALSGGTQTQGEAPAGAKQPGALTTEELAVCTSLGIDPEEFKKNKPA